VTVVPISDDQPGPVRSRLERVPALPDRRRAAAVARWWFTDGVRRLGTLAVRAPWLLLVELRPIGIGFGRLVMAWARWCNADDYAARIAANAALGVAHKDDPTRLEAKRGRRRLLSGVVGTVLALLVWAVALRWSGWLLAGAGAVVVGCDAYGRRVAPTPTVSLPGPARAVLTEGVPLTQITRAIVDRARDRWGIDLGIARAMGYDHARREYEVWVTCGDPLTREHTADFERAIGAADHAMRCLAPPDGNALVRRLVIRDGDPLAEPTPRPFLPTGSRSITEPLPIGVSMTDVPFALDFTQHIRVVAGTGGGKTKWFLRSMIDAVSACRDAVLLGADVTYGPEIPMWRGVFQRSAFTPENAEKLLDEILAEIADRAGVLTAIAEDDDPTNDADSWHAGLGPYWIVFLDEYPQIAAFDGRNGRLDLLSKCEQIIRTARKHGIFLVMFGQKTGNADFGSTVMSSQCGATILGPCDPGDTVRLLGAERRDQGYMPHLLTRGTNDDPHDAGKCYLDSPHHTTPDQYRAFAPGSNAEVKRRARQRIADGLPAMRGQLAAVDAVEVPTVLVEVEAAFAGVDRLATVELLEVLRAGGVDLDERGLAEQLRPHGVAPSRWRPAPGANPVRGYLLADVRAALGGFE
jgi:hypothetical protein